MKYNKSLLFFKQQLDKNLAFNVFKNGVWGTYRHLLLNQSIVKKADNSHLRSMIAGDLSSLKWTEMAVQNTPYDIQDKILIRTNYSPVNFKDIMTASGKVSVDSFIKDRLQQEEVWGCEFSGKDLYGRRIMGICRAAFATTILADKHLSIPVPDDMSLEEAATIPVVYGTVLYSFNLRTKIKYNSSILIHSATGGVGQAAVRIALSYKCKIFVTVGTPEKRKFINKTFPEINDSHIGNSRDTSFVQMVLRETNGRGVDMVLNSLAEEKLLASVKCLAKGGKFIEIGKFDLSNDSELNLMLLQKQASFHGSMLDKISMETPEVKQKLMKLIEEGIKSSTIKPLNTTVFVYNEVEQAFRYMSSGKHIGKVLIKVREEEPDFFKSNIEEFNCLARYWCDPNKSYIIVGGLGGFGLELADWLILRGARKLVLNSRRGITSGYQQYRMKIWSSYGVLIKICQSNVLTKEGCEILLKESDSLGPVDGIFNLAVVLADAVFENQTVESFLTSFGPKALATTFLDETSRKMCPSLKSFVVFSSVSCGRGNPGQTNYGMANSFMERICEMRRREGYPAVAIQWGAIGEVGLVAAMQKEHKELEIGGTLQQKISSCLNVLDILLVQNEAAIVSSMVVAEKRKSDNKDDNVVDIVMGLIGVRDLKSISHHSTLAELGMDSMIAVEIKQILERDFGILLTSKEIRNLNVLKLAKINEQFNVPSLTSEKTTQEIKHSIYGTIKKNAIMTTGLSKLKSMCDSSIQETIFIFPGIDGDGTYFKDLLLGVKANVYCVEYGVDIDARTVQELVNHVLPFIKEQLNNSKSFKFVAYSFGGMVALEVAHHLESEERIGNIFLIDTSPSMIKNVIIFNIKKYNSDLEMSILCEMLQFLYTSEEITDLQKTLETCHSSRVDMVIDMVRKKSNYSVSYLRTWIKGLMRKIELIMTYEISFNKLKSKLVLLRASEMHHTDQSNDSGLVSIAQHPVDVHVIECNHFTILLNDVTIQKFNEWISLFGDIKNTENI